MRSVKCAVEFGVVCLLSFSSLMVSGTHAQDGESVGTGGQTTALAASEGELPPWQRLLAGHDSVRVGELEAQIKSLRGQGAYAEAVAPAESALALRERAQGADHWQVGDARRLVDTLRRASALPPAAQGLLASADRAAMQIEQLYAEGKYGEALAAAKEALETRRRLQGSEHPEALQCLGDVAVMLDEAGECSVAEELHREALSAKLKALGPDHPDIGSSMGNLGLNLADHGMFSEALGLLRIAHANHRRLLGDSSPSTAVSANNLAWILAGTGDYPAADSLFRESLETRRKALGDYHPAVAQSLSNLSDVLRQMGDYAAAEPLARQAILIQRGAHGENHPELGGCLNSLGVLLIDKGDYGAAEAVIRESMGIRRRLLGEEHPDIAENLNGLAAILCRRGDLHGGKALLEEALQLRRKTLGNAHPHIAVILGNLSSLLRQNGEHVDAERLQREALAMREDLLGHEHPAVGVSLSHLGLMMQARGSYAAAESLLQESLAVRLKAVGEKHPLVAAAFANLARLLYVEGRYAQAESLWLQAAVAFEAARGRVGFAGLERIQFSEERSPFFEVAAIQARTGNHHDAWRHIEAGMARGMMDEVSARLTRPLSGQELNRARSLRGRLALMDERLGSLAATETEAQRGIAETMAESEGLQAEFAQFQSDMAAKYGVAAGEVYGLDRIQGELGPGDAIVAWVDMKGDPHAVDPNGEHWGCVVRHTGEPVWVKLPGSGDAGSWTAADDSLPRALRRVLGDVARQGEVGKLVARAYRQRLAPLEPHLEVVDHLIVLPAGWMAGVPVEALTDWYTVSYAPSGTMYAWLREKGARPETHAGLLALGDPAFEQPQKPERVLPEAPQEGVLLAMVSPESNAERSGLREGDVLLTYRGEVVAGPAELGPAIAAAAEDSVVPVTVWREGVTVEASVAPGKLGVRPDQRPVPEAIAQRRRLDGLLAGTRGGRYEPLPWTRAEVEGIAELFGKGDASTILVGPQATERRLDELARSGELGTFRYIHLATHAVMDDEVAMRSALILSKEPVDDSYERALRGEEVYDGRLTAEQIVRTWKIDADMVVLSGCETALGKESGGEGFLGFSQALFVAGARTLVLSLWKVQDTPTMLLMRRFYENLMGRHRDPREVSGREYSPGEAIPKAEALREAKEWLRDLTWEELEMLEVGGLGEAVRGERAGGAATMASGAYPYADPHYWAAFVLVGDPE